MADDSQKKKPMTDEERLELAAKMDKELDAFIDGLEKKRYADGWPEDRWEEEMDKHPFFMKKAPTEFDEMNPLMAGMQQLKYDSEENTTEELTLTYKDDGNFYVKHKKYKMAIISYTEALKLHCENVELNATIYNNRSAAHFFLKNYRSSLNDALKCLSLKEEYPKALWRAAQCASHLNRFDECIDLCDRILGSDGTNQQAISLRAETVKRKTEQLRDERKAQVLKKKSEEKTELLIKALEHRDVHFEEQPYNSSEIREEYFKKPALAPLESFPVHLDNHELVWPVAFSYPEFLFSDFQQQVAENCSLYDVLRELLCERLLCDKEHKYKADNVNVYYENRKAAKVFKIDVQKTIRNIVGEKTFLVTGGAILLYVVPKDSKIEQEFVNHPRRSIVFN